MKNKIKQVITMLIVTDSQEGTQERRHGQTNSTDNQTAHETDSRQTNRQT
jgi:hypothetical protein